jgi:flagellar biosynthesis protein FlhG
MITVAGGKGGVGTSTIAANLAMALAAQGRRTVLVEADLDRTASGLATGAEDCSILDALTGRRTVHEILRRGPGGIQVLPGAFAPSEVVECSAMAQQRLIDELKSLGRHAEVVVVDAGGGRNPFIRRLWQAAGLVLLVTTADSASIVESYAAIKVLSGGDAAIPLYTLVNRVADGAQAAEAHARLGAACRRFLGLHSCAAGHVPLHAGEGGETVRQFLLQSPQSETARSLERVAETLWTAITDDEVRSRKKPHPSQIMQTAGAVRGGLTLPEQASLASP